MAAQPDARHPTQRQSYRERASLPNTSPLASYLLRLIELKRTNLCVSADVTSTSELLSLAEEVGDSICILKTHADIVSDFGDRTIRGLREIAARKRFLVFEDRKFGDIGSTVQKQYTSGPLSIAKWAEITNAHLFPGPAIVRALKSAAADAVLAYNTSVQTDITSGSPTEGSPHPATHDSQEGQGLENGVEGERKRSVVSVTHTISTQSEPASPRQDAGTATMAADGETLGPAPLSRSLLILAEMSSEGNFLKGEYTDTCVEVAREHGDFVMGFIAQRSLNALPQDNFITMTPGVSLPPPQVAGSGEGGGGAGKMGDGLGQQYNTPVNVVLGKGADVIIVGRGVYGAADWKGEAERYRKAGWEAYERRIAGR